MKQFYINDKVCYFDENSFELIIEGRKMTPNIRTYGQMKDLYLEKEDFDDEKAMYLMYRGVYLNKDDEQKFKENNFRYDITVMLPIMVKDEYNKTFGHYHPKNENGKHYQEIYQVLYGNARYLQQNNEKTFYSNVNVGQSIIMEESFGHITINPNDDVLIMANIVSDKFSSVYDDYKTKKGGRYYLTKNGWIKNPNYNDNIELENKQDLFITDDIYKNYLKNPNLFSFIN